MSVDKDLEQRSESKCELCSATEGLRAYEVPDSPDSGVDAHIYVCETCESQIEKPETVDANHWRCLNDSMWSQVPAVQVMAWRMLNRLRGEGWPVDLLEMMYLADETMAWAKASGDGEEKEEVAVHKDAFGNQLQTGDTVLLTKTLDVKGSTVIAKRGTAVRGISLVHDNHEHIEGRVNGQRVVILTKFVKKST